MSSPQWIRTAKRLRIYARDAWRCLWCQARVARTNDPERARQRLAEATLDHVLPRARGGSNHHGNLITACHRCNCNRQHRSAIAFAFDTALRDTACEILARVITAMGKELPK